MKSFEDPNGACEGGSRKKGWCQWLRDFFRPRQFEVEWDGKARGRGSANVGVPNLRKGGDKGERGHRPGRGIAIIHGRYCVDIIDREGGNGINMQWVEVEVKRIVREVTEECRL